MKAGGISKVWICGPPRMKESLAFSLRNHGHSEEIYYLCDMVKLSLKFTILSLFGLLLKIITQIILTICYLPLLVFYSRTVNG
jgi:hypothetical protein